MFKVLIFLLLCFPLMASDISLLRVNKQEIIKSQKKEIESNAEQIKYEWLSPLNISSSYSKSASQNDAVSDSSINLQQDIFRSGGIMYKMEYADTKLQNSLSSLALENSALYESLFTGLLELKRLNLVLEQNHLTYLNAEIEVFLKTQQYKVGDVDITELNRALREKNSALKVELLAKQASIEKKITLQKLTDKELETIEIPTFELVSKDEYEKTNYNLKIAKLNTELSDKSYKISKSSYLPTLSINAAYGYQENPNINFNDDYHSVGITLSMPLDYNYNASLEESKSAYLTSKLQIQESQIDTQALYDTALSKIKNYEKYKEVTQDNILLYANLIEIVQKAFKSGLKTGYDLKTLQNTNKIDELELQVSDINIQLELAKLIFATKIGENYYE